MAPVTGYIRTGERIRWFAIGTVVALAAQLLGHYLAGSL